MLEAFVASLLLITISELGDKTFFIAVILSFRHSRTLVFISVMAALIAMTLLSVFMGHLLKFLPALYILWAEVLLFLAFGIKLLLQAKQMPIPENAACQDACQDALAVVNQAEKEIPKPTIFGLFLQSFGMTFLAEWGDRTQIATIGLAASKEMVGVILGSILGHAICTAIAVIGGKMIAGRISERMVTGLGGVLFLVFALVGLWKAVAGQGAIASVLS